jgi:hypothetical protein
LKKLAFLLILLLCVAGVANPITSLLVGTLAAQSWAKAVTFFEIAFDRARFEKAAQLSGKVAVPSGKCIFTSFKALGMQSLPPRFLRNGEDIPIRISRWDEHAYSVSFVTADLHHAGVYGLVYSSKRVSQQEAANLFDESGYAIASQVGPDWFAVEDHSD